MIGVFSNMNGSMKNDVVFAFMQTCSRIGEKMDVVSELFSLLKDSVQE